jgi:hypothetical protein
MLKSEVPYGNENDFVETNGGLKELTVTITLNEYRTLIQKEENNLNYIAKLEEENKRLNVQNTEYVKLILNKFPELKGKINDMSEILMRSEQE